MDPLLGRRPSSALSVALAVCLVVITALYLWRAFDPQLVEFAEGPILTVAERMRQEPISAHWEHEIPYTLSAYGPAYFECVVLAAKFGPVHASLVPGRLVALLAVLATAAVIGLAVRRRTGRTEPGLLGAVAYLVSPAVFYWAPAVRVDTLAVFFSCAAYLAVGPGRTSLMVSAALVALGSLAKPTAALSAVPIFVYLLVNKRYRDACWYALAVSVCGGLLWWAVAWYSQGYFWTVAVRNNLNRMLITNGLRSLGSILLAPFSWLCLAIVARQWKEHGTLATLRSLFCLSFVASLLISTVLACREGSHINYFLEPCALGSVLIGLFAIPPAATEMNHRRRGALAFFAAGVIAPGLVALVAWSGAFARQSPADQTAVKRILAQAPRDCQLLADGEWVPCVLDSGRLPLVNDPYMLRLLADRKLLPTAPIIDALDSGRVCLLILDRSIEEHRLPEPGRWPADVLDAMARNFVPVVQEPGLCVYRNRRNPAN
jgi:hypothetical protein